MNVEKRKIETIKDNNMVKFKVVLSDPINYKIIANQLNFSNDCGLIDEMHFTLLGLEENVSLEILYYSSSNYTYLKENQFNTKENLSEIIYQAMETVVNKYIKDIDRLSKYETCIYLDRESDDIEIEVIERFKETNLLKNNLDFKYEVYIGKSSSVYANISDDLFSGKIILYKFKDSKNLKFRIYRKDESKPAFNDFNGCYSILQNLVIFLLLRAMVVDNKKVIADYDLKNFHNLDILTHEELKYILIENLPKVNTLNTRSFSKITGRDIVKIERESIVPNFIEFCYKLFIRPEYRLMSENSLEYRDCHIKQIFLTKFKSNDNLIFNVEFEGGRVIDLNNLELKESLMKQVIAYSSLS